ncbi:MAG TPA: glucose-1-phosphate adenylyltransferase [Candidatus Atribacteria bacterium]|nr:glucose-1-phosphate adenylyltransferase [Candidatus Atribacteria bacterium]
MYKREVLALILAGGEGKRLDILSEKRAKPAVPFGGKYRIIDFPLSNCVNSGLYCVGIPTQYNPRSLHEHIGIGKFWDLDRMEGGVFLLQPYISDMVTHWYRGTADAVYQNLRFIRDQDPYLVLILSGDHVYKMDYRQLIRFHQERKADLTIAVMEVPWEEAHRFGVLSLDERGRVVDFEEKPPHPRSNLINMGVYVFDRHVLEEEVEEEALREGTSFDFGKDIIPRMIGRRKVYGFCFSGYWKDVGTIDAYWEANMELLGSSPALDLYDKRWPIYTYIEDRPPVKLSHRARIKRSLLGSGAIIDGSVEDSVIFSGVYVSRGAEVRHSIVMSDTLIDEEAVVDRAILDKRIVVGKRAKIGYGEDLRPNKKIPDMLKSGLTIVGRNARIPPEAIVGRNCRIGADIKEEDFTSHILESGESIEKAEEG